MAFRVFNYRVSRATCSFQRSGTLELACLASVAFYGRAHEADFGFPFRQAPSYMDRLRKTRGKASVCFRRNLMKSRWNTQAKQHAKSFLFWPVLLVDFQKRGDGSISRQLMEQTQSNQGAPIHSNPPAALQTNPGLPAVPTHAAPTSRSADLSFPSLIFLDSPSRSLSIPVRTQSKRARARAGPSLVPPHPHLLYSPRTPPASCIPTYLLNRSREPGQLQALTTKEKAAETSAQLSGCMPWDRVQRSNSLLGDSNPVAPSCFPGGRARLSGPRRVRS